MCTSHQLDAIDRHLRKENWLLNEEFIAELTDHYISSITDRLAEGSSFEQALASVHQDFGGRTGLLNMEEQYAHNQFLRTRRTSRAVFLAYLKPPRLAISLLLLACFYQLTSAYPHHGRYAMIQGGLMALVLGGGVAAAFILLIERFKSRQNSITNHRKLISIGVLVGNFGLVTLVALGPEIWVEPAFYNQHVHVFDAAGLTASVIYLLSTVEYLMKAWPTYGTVTTPVSGRRP
ncbi:hypothetical protein [Spirosoma sp. 209]|uniref:hypothetical protein n=1 Tax=Spirosoma sp. 209 TaxID=1955701 RepID=UPI00098D1BD8|nr:hypothetical protein [Spirosoma sp. 209]